nr:hypothetical protein [Nitrososphaerota archaeon]
HFVFAQGYAYENVSWAQYVLNNIIRFANAEFIQEGIKIDHLAESGKDHFLLKRERLAQPCFIAFSCGMGATNRQGLLASISTSQGSPILKGKAESSLTLVGT